MDILNKLIAATLPAVPRPLVRRLSARYIAGETDDDALECVRALNADGMMATLDILGEFVGSAAEAERAAEEYRVQLQAFVSRGLDSNVSIKLSQMGLVLDPELAYRLTRSVAEQARDLGNFVRLDMEDSPWTDLTLSIHDRLRAEGLPVGCVIQAYLRRSAVDVAKLAASGANVRLCKGIYVEPEAICFKDPEEIRDSYRSLLRTLLEAKAYVGIATHDESLVHHAFALIDELGVDRNAYEFQMLLGVTEGLRARILDRGHRLRVYVPYGSHWYAYSLRRLKENPQIAGYALKGLFARD